jgi:AcrR family transcriptional regulator
MVVSVDTSLRRSGGRLPDQTRDADIKGVVLELLAEGGYERMTIEAVAARAHAGKATIYRRWPSKIAMVLDAINDLKPNEFDLPDTGSLSGDIRAFFELAAIRGPDDSFRLIAGLASGLIHDAELAHAFRDHFIGPRMARLQLLLDRAAMRGEIPRVPNADMICAVFPAFMLHRTVFGGEPPDREYVRRIVEEVLVPLITATTASNAKGRR